MPPKWEQVRQQVILKLAKYKCKLDLNNNLNVCFFNTWGQQGLYCNEGISSVTCKLLLYNLWRVYKSVFKS